MHLSDRGIRPQSLYTTVNGKVARILLPPGSVLVPRPHSGFGVNSRPASRRNHMTFVAKSNFISLRWIS
jgi:hypothetical protein